MDPTPSSSAKPTKPFVFPVMKKAIEDLFAKSEITKEDIEAFQDRYWEQLVPNFSQALKLLDIHGVRRHNILWSINDRLLDAIKTNIESKSEDSDQKKCQKLWQKLIKTGIVYIHHPYMRPLIMQVLGKMNAIRERHVNLVVDNPYLYDDAPLPVLRHIWVAHPHKFREEMDQMITRFQTGWSDSLLEALSMAIGSTASSTADLIPLLYRPPRRRRRDASIMRMAEMIGEDQILYDKVIRIIREECQRAEKSAMDSSSTHAPSRHLSAPILSPPPKRRRRINSTTSSSSDDRPTLEGITTATAITSPAFLVNPVALSASLLPSIRFDLLMSLNEAKIDSLCVPDRIHQFVWCLDACVRNRRIDQRHASGLAYHLTVQRQRAKKADSLRDEQSSDSGVDHTTGTSKSSSKGSQERGAHSRGGGGEEDEAKLNETESILLERDLHMICRDPWVVYTICTSLIWYTLNGLYEFKLPRDISEISLLIQFLLTGVADDFRPITAPDQSEQTSRTKIRHSSPHEPAEGAEEVDVASHPDTALMGHILPAIAQLQVLVWRAQVAEEILHTSTQLWPCGNVVPGLPTSPLSPTPVGRRPSASGDLREGSSLAAPPALQKQITNATQSTTVSVPSDYFVHPIGYLMLQYHTLFALERNELFVLRALLRVAASATTAVTETSSSSSATPRSPRSSSRSSPVGSKSSKAGPSSPPPPTLTARAQKPAGSSQWLFRWRPEVLQALALGIARLPTSAPAFVDSGRGVVNRPRGTGAVTLDSGASVIGGTVTGVELTGTPKAGTVSSSNPLEHRNQAVSMLITRAELASLLRSSLALDNDLDLMVLSQLALLLPSGQPTTLATGVTPGGNPLLTPAPTDMNPVEQPHISSPQLTERERWLATLSRHCCTNSGGTPDAAPSATASTSSELTVTTPNIYKSTNPRVSQALDVLRRELMDRSMLSSALPLIPSLGTPSAKFGCGSGGSSVYPSISPGYSNPYNSRPSSGPFQIPSQPDSFWPPHSATPRSPTGMGKSLGSRHHNLLSASPSYSGASTRVMEGKGYSNAFFPSSGSGHPLSLSATPFTNPGLSGATPHLNLHGSSTMPPPANVPPPTPRRPSTPPREFLPASPLPVNPRPPTYGATCQASGVSSTSASAFGAELAMSCPSPRPYASTSNGSALQPERSPPAYSRPRSPTPPTSR